MTAAPDAEATTRPRIRDARRNDARIRDAARNELASPAPDGRPVLRRKTMLRGMRD